MNVDIDQFIRDQKSKIADERSYLSNKVLPISKVNYNEKFNEKVTTNGTILNNDGFVLKMREGENMKNKYKQELRNEFTMVNRLDKHMGPYSARKENVSSDTSDDEGLLYGLKYSNSATKRKEKIRNDEYNEFKTMEEEKFRNRFSNKKNIVSRVVRDNNESLIRSNPIASNGPPSQGRGVRPQKEMETVDFMSKNSNNNNQPRTFESKIDELERKVEELRNFRIQNPYIIYPNEDSTQRDNMDQRRFNEAQEGSNSLRYSSTNLGQNHLKYLEETEHRLKEIEEKYDRRKSTIMTNGRQSHKKLHPILDDDELFDRDSFNQKFTGLKLVNKSQHRNDSKSIIPTGRDNEEEIKRKRQEEYRLQLQLQMKEKKTDKSRSADQYEQHSFLDRFSHKEEGVVRRKEMPMTAVETDNDYFFYASHNPLDEYDLPAASLVNSGYSKRPQDNIRLSDSDLQTNKKTETNLFFGERDNKSDKGNYRNELKKQIEETKMRKEFEKKKLEDYERRKNEEIARYEPFGRGGGGAPLKNDKGETISDLKRIRFDPDIVKRDPPPLKPSFNERPEVSAHSIVEPPNSERGFARGGNGIFGNALSDEDKVKAERYKEELQIQIGKNKRQKEIDKETERIREENERMKFEKEQKQIQIELENEKKRQQEKDIERLRLLEESKNAASKEKEIKKAAAKEMERAMSIDDTRERRKEDRVFSPIIRKETPHEEKDSLQDRSKLEIEATERAQTHREDSKILSQLYKLKNQLGNEKLRVEQALIRQRDEVEIYDPRLNKDKPLKNTKSNEDEYSSDIFQSIIDNRKPLTVRRDHLKHKTVTPRKHKTTEADLDEHLKYQEKLLERMYQKDFSKLELMMPKMEPQHVGLRPSTQMSNQLESDSAFIRFDQSSDFQLRQSQSQASDIDYNVIKPRTPKLSINSEFGSNTSLNIDELTRKNQQRLRKLQKLQDENDSNQSSEDILNKIVSRNNNDSDLFNGL